MRRPSWRRVARGSVFGIAALAIAGGFALWLTPFPQELLRPIGESTEFVDRTGRPLRRLLVDERKYARCVRLEEVSPYVVAATLSAEDQRFQSHPGIDLLAILRAGGESLWSGRKRSGASTITQQLVKLARPGPRTIGRKVEEMWLALRVERSWSKERILTEYLNRLDYGELQIGIAAASEHYFAKPAADLSAAEAALLAGLPKAPTRLNPHTQPQDAERRRAWVIHRMLATHRLDVPAADRALAEPLRLAPAGQAYVAPRFVDLLLSRRSVLPAEGGIVKTTLDLDLNEFAERALERNLRSLGEKHASAGAAVVLDNRSGEVLTLACASTAEAAAASDVNTAWMVRSPGSAMKPFTYVLALEHGAFPGTVVPDVPTDFPTETGAYRPNNYNHRFYGPVSLRFALGNSLNVAAIRVLELAGGPEALQVGMRACGVTTLDHPCEYYGLGLTLGNGEVRLLELANAYATLARLGEYQEFRLLRREEAAGVNRRRVFDAKAAFLLADMLADNTARAASFGLDSFLRFDFPVAVKTGTSSDYRDNWCMGYTPEFTVAVWVGNADGRPMQGITGVTGASPVLHELFEHLHATRGTSWYAMPDLVHSYAIEPLTGHRVPEGFPGAIWEKAISAPALASAADYDEAGRVVLPAAYREWLASKQNVLGSLAAGGRAASGNQDLEVSAPAAGSVFFLDPDLPAERQCIPLRANSPHAVVWSSDTLTVRTGTTEARAQLAAGQHRLMAKDPVTGKVASTWIEVRAL